MAASLFVACQQYISMQQQRQLDGPTWVSIWSLTLKSLQPWLKSITWPAFPLNAKTEDFYSSSCFLQSSSCTLILYNCYYQQISEFKRFLGWLMHALSSVRSWSWVCLIECIADEGVVSKMFQPASWFVSFTAPSFMVSSVHGLVLQTRQLCKLYRVHVLDRLILNWQGQFMNFGA